MKKLAALAGAGALLLASGGMILACHGGGCRPPRQSDDLTVTNSAHVNNKVLTVSNTGFNDIGGRCVFGGTIRTGMADAYSWVGNYVNQNDVGCNDCGGDTTLRNRASVNNRVLTVANTGFNSIGGMMVGGGRIGTGAALSTSIVENAVNTNIVGGAIH